LELEKGRCPDCGAKMVRKCHTEVWDPEGNPTEIYEDWYCPQCNTMWVPEEPIPNEHGRKEASE